MQKSQIIYFFALQITDKNLELGLFAGTQLLASCMIDKLQANQLLVDHLSVLLAKASLRLGDVAYIAVNIGPASITSLRVVLATVNAISFASKIPLIAIDGLRVLLETKQNPEYPITLVLFNAYNQDCFYGLQLPDQSLSIGCQSVNVLLQQLKNFKSVRVMGPGIIPFKESLEQHPNLVIDEAAQFLSLSDLGRISLQHWQSNFVSSYQLLPLYTKSTHYKTVF